MKFSERVMARELRKWANVTADPLWYQKIGPEKLQFANPRRPATLVRAAAATALTPLQPEIKLKAATKPAPKHLLYLIFEELLETEQVKLGSAEQGSYEWDSERLPIDRVIVHHSKSPQPMRQHYISAMELLRVYTPVYNQPAPSDVERVSGQPIYSGHYDRAGRQGFWIYNWMVRPGGDRVRHLSDEAIGWQAGNWMVNRSSVSICIDDDLSHVPPRGAALESVAEILTNNYSHLNLGPDTLLGHNEVSLSTPCPGDQFIPVWKDQLLKMVSA